MTGAGETEDIELLAERLYAARAALAEAQPRVQPPAQRLGVAELMQFLCDPRRSLSLDQQRALFASPRLLADYRRLKAERTLVALPALAAASIGEVSARRFEGGSVRIHPSRVAGQVYVVMRMSWPAGPPRTVLLESASGELLKRALPAADVNGEIMMVLDENSSPDQAFLRLITDPTTTGSFLV